MTTTPRRLLTRLGVLTATAILGTSTLAACGAGQDGTTLAGATTATIRYQSYAGGVDPLQLADALGYLQGITLSKVGDVTGGPASLQALASHQIDISSSAFFGAIAQVEANGVPIKAVVSTYGSNAKVSEQIVALSGTTITSAKDLIGKKLAVNTLGANEEAVVDTWARKSGLTASQIGQIILVPLPPLNALEALQQHQVDAAVVSSSQVRAVQQSGLKLTAIVKDTEVIGDYNGGGLAVTDAFLKQSPAIARVLITGVAKAVSYIEHHDRSAVLKIYDAWLTRNGYSSYIAAVDKNWAGTTGVASPDSAAISDQDFSTWVTWLEQRGTIHGNLTPSSLYTNAYNELAKGGTS